MPTVAAMALASVVSFVLEDVLRPYVGFALTSALSLAVWCLVFWSVRNGLRRLRDGS